MYDSRMRNYGIPTVMPPCAENERPSVDEVVSSTESRMRGIRMSGLMSREWKRIYGAMNGKQQEEKQ